MPFPCTVLHVVTRPQREWLRSRGGTSVFHSCFLRNTSVTPLFFSRLVWIWSIACVFCCARALSPAPRQNSLCNLFKFMTPRHSFGCRCSDTARDFFFLGVRESGGRLSNWAVLISSSRPFVVTYAYFVGIGCSAMYLGLRPAELVSRG